MPKREPQPTSPAVRAAAPEHEKPARRTARIKGPAKVRDLRALALDVVAGITGADDRLARALYPRVRAVVATVVGGHPHARDDVVQRVVAKILLRHVERLASNEIKKPEAWLARVARNGAHDWTAAAKRRREGEAAVASAWDGYDESDELPSIADERWERVSSALQKLPAHHRDVLVLRFLEGRRPPEIAVILRIPTGTVTSRLTNAMKRICAVLGVPFRPRKKAGRRSSPKR